MNELIIACGCMAVICIAGGAAYIADVVCGDAALPKLRKRKKKIPRKGGASHGIVGQQVRRAEYGYIKIVPQPDPRVKGLRVEKSYRR